jgi:hypothetical protein
MQSLVSLERSQWAEFLVNDFIIFFRPNLQDIEFWIIFFIIGNSIQIQQTQKKKDYMAGSTAHATQGH